MIKIVPAILEKDCVGLKKRIEETSKYFSYVQIDAVDGIFVDKITFPYLEKGVINDKEDLEINIGFEVDGMSVKPLEAINFWKPKGMSRYILHIHACEDYPSVVRQIHEMGIKVGIAILPSDDVGCIEKVIDYIDGVQCMGIREVGAQGQPFADEVLTLIARIKIKYPHLPIGVDGSVNADTICPLIKAGATSLSIGSALLNGDIKENMEKLEDVILKCDI